MEERKLDDNHPYGGYDALVGAVCLYYDRLARENVMAVVYGAYDVEGSGRMYAILLENQGGLFHAMSGVRRDRLVPIALDSLDAKQAYHRLLAGIIDQESDLRMRPMTASLQVGGRRRLGGKGEK